MALLQLQQAILASRLTRSRWASKHRLNRLDVLRPDSPQLAIHPLGQDALVVDVEAVVAEFHLGCRERQTRELSAGEDAADLLRIATRGFFQRLADDVARVGRASWRAVG